MPLDRKKMTRIHAHPGHRLIGMTATGQEDLVLAYPGDLILAMIPMSEEIPAGWIEFVAAPHAVEEDDDD